MEPVKVEMDRQGKEMDELESIKGRKKKAALEEWVHQNCRFARINLQ